MKPIKNAQLKITKTFGSFALVISSRADKRDFVSDNKTGVAVVVELVWWWR